MNKAEEMGEILQRSFSDIQKYGTAAQRAQFFQNQILLNFRIKRYLIDEQMLSYAEQMMKYSVESDSLIVLSFSSFLQGFVLLWYNNIIPGKKKTYCRVFKKY